MRTTITKLVLLACWVSVLAICSPVSTFGSERTRKVLIFSSDAFFRPGISVMEEGIRSTLVQDVSYQFQFYYEALDESRIPNDKYDVELAAFLSRKYDGENFDLIFAVGATSLRFLVKHESELFTNAPKVFVTVDHRQLAELKQSSNVTGAAGKLEFGTTLDLILKIHPKTKRVVVITGGADREQFFLEQTKKDIEPYAGKFDVLYLSKLSIAELQKAVSSLPPDNVVLFVSYGRDPTGRGYSVPLAVKEVAPYSNVPIYTSSDVAIGMGAVGGNVINFGAMGGRAGQMGLRMLAGEKPSEIPPETVESISLFDWRQLRRWSIAEQALPAGSIVQYREPTVWEQYKWEIVGIAAFSIFQTILIAWLLFLRARKKTAESESVRFASLALTEHKKLDDVVANVPGIVWESRVLSGADDRQIEFVSDYVQTMLGYTPEEVAAIPNFWTSVVHKDDYEEVFQASRRIVENREPAVQEFRCITKDGATIWADAHLIPNCDEAGNVIGIRGVAIDVTDRKLAENELNSREVELSEAQRLAQIGSWNWDPATDTVHWSEELYNIAGLDPSQAAPSFEQQAALYTPESYERLAAAVAQALEDGSPYELETEMICYDGRRLWTHARGEVLRDEEQKIIRLRGTLQDISARKEAEEALAVSNERYRNVVETQTELICRYLPDTTLTFVNDAYCRYFGKTSEELIGNKFIDLIPPYSREAVLALIGSLVENPRTETHEHEVVRPDGKRGWHQWVDRRVETFNGHQIELQGIGRDITEKRQIEEELRASESRFRTMADSAPVLIWMCGPDRLCNYVNQGWLDFTGRSLDLELGSGWTVGIHPHDYDRTKEIFDSSFERRAPFKLEYRLRAADGAFRWVYDTGTPRFSSDGEFLGYIGSCVDISERREAEEAASKAHEEVRSLQEQLHEENIYLKEVIKLEHNFEEIIGHSDALKYVLFKIEQVAPTNASVLIAGETGTGKELVARAIHSTSLRKSRPLVSVNCAALSATLIESELFGHERGAFTGATTRKIGRFELADGATLFLDEIGELPMELQVKLLRILQEGEFERLGSSNTMKADVRVIAATNRDLNAEVKKGTFREDLLFRLNVFPITIPPLRERKDDIPELVEHFTHRFSKKLGKTIRSVSPAAIRNLARHSWPGNIRELANVIERSVINAQSENLQVFENFDTPNVDNGASILVETLESVERKYISEILDRSGWKIEGANGAARILGLNPSTLRTRMAKLNISKKTVLRPTQ